MLRSVIAVAAVAMVAASVSGTEEQTREAIPTAMPEPTADVPEGSAFSLHGLEDRARPLGPDTPPWARRLYWRSLRVLLALTDPRTGAMIAGQRDGWDYVWPRDASAGAIALQAAGLHVEARRVTAFLSDLDLDRAARFYPNGSRVPGRTAAGDGEGWVRAAEHAVTASTYLDKGHSTTQMQEGPLVWRGRQDYGENVTGDLLGNAIAAGAPAGGVRAEFEAARGLRRESGGEALDSSAAWAATVFPSGGLAGAIRTTLLGFARESTPYGIPPMEGWTPGEVWTAPTAWTAWALVNLGETAAADRLLAELHRAETPDGTLPERVNEADGQPTSTTPLAWSHAFAILALLARYP